MPYGYSNRRAYPVQSIPSPNSAHWQTTLGLLGGLAQDSSQRQQAALGGMSELAAFGAEQARSQAGNNYYDDLRQSGERRNAINDFVGSIGLETDPSAVMQAAAFNDETQAHQLAQIKKGAAEAAQIKAAESQYGSSQLAEAWNAWAIKYPALAQTEITSMTSDQLAELQQNAKAEESRAAVTKWYDDYRSGNLTAPPLQLNEKGVLDVPPGLNETFRVISAEQQAARAQQVVERSKREERMHEQRLKYYERKETEHNPARDRRYEFARKRIEEDRKRRVVKNPYDPELDKAKYEATEKHNQQIWDAADKALDDLYRREFPEDFAATPAAPGDQVDAPQFTAGQDAAAAFDRGELGPDQLFYVNGKAYAFDESGANHPVQ